jgi:hypothetical protein
VPFWLDELATGSRYRQIYRCQEFFVTASLDGGQSFVPEVKLSSARNCPDTALNGEAGRRWPAGGDYTGLATDPSGRFHVLPHDMNEAIGIGGPGGGNAQLDPLVGMNDATKPLRSKLLAVPALRERYLGYVKDIATKWLDWNRMGPLVQQYQALIAADVAADTRKLYATDAFQGEVASLKSFAEARRALLIK